MGADDRPPELLANGDEPGDARTSRWRALAERLPARAGPAVAGGLFVVALVAGGAWYAGRPELPPTPPHGAATPSPAAPAVTSTEPLPDAFANRAVEGLPLARSLVAPAAPADDSFIASGGHVLLFIQVRNTGKEPLRVVEGLVPQAGAEGEFSGGGYTAGTSSGAPLLPGQTAEVYVRLRLDCSVSTQGDPANRLLLVTQFGSRRPAMQSIPLDALGSLWDEARHAACRPVPADAAVTAAVLPGSLTPVRGAGGSLVVRATVRVHDSAGFGAVLLWGSGGSTFVGGGSTVSATVGWDAGSCAHPGPVPGPLAYQVRLPDGSAVATTPADPGFSPEWRTAVASACR
jgi:hypothetical protein